MPLVAILAIVPLAVPFLLGSRQHAESSPPGGPDEPFKESLSFPDCFFMLCNLDRFASRVVLVPC